MSKIQSLKRYIMTRSLHLGNIKRSFTKGTIIEKNENSRTLIIDGESFSATKDLDILINNKWAVPYSDKSFESITSTDCSPLIKDKPSKNTSKNMEIIESDEDTFTEIDIKHTVKAKKDYSKDKNKKLEVIIGDESAEDNLERVAREKMKIVEDDGSCGIEVGKTPALNAGKVKTPKVSNSEIEAKKEQRKADAIAKKLQKKASRESEDDFVFESPEEAANGISSDKSEEKEIKAVITEENGLNCESSNDAAKSLVDEEVKKPKGRPKTNNLKVEPSKEIPSAVEFE